MKRVVMLVVMMALAWAAWGKGPGDYYLGGGESPGVFSPYWRTITVYGSVETNDVLIFMDKTGAKVRATNVIDQVGYWARYAISNSVETTVGASGTVWRAEWQACDAGKVSTNDTRYLATLTNGSPHSSLSGIQGAGTLHVTDGDTNKIATAWQNPASATNWTWISDGVSATMISYSGPSDVVIPDRVNNLPVTGVGTIFAGGAITSISGGANVTSIGEAAFSSCTALTSVTLPAATSIAGYAFYRCTALTSVTLPAATSIGDTAFYRCAALTSVTLPAATSIGDTAFYLCAALTSVTLPAATSIGDNAFEICTALTSVTLPAATSIGDFAFSGCTALKSVYFGQNAPAEAADVYLGTTNATNYVTSSTATGWGATWNGRPVVRLHGYFDGVTIGGTNLTDLLAAKVPTNGMTDTIHGARGGLNLHSLADGSGAGFLSAMDYVALASVKGRTNVWNAMTPSTPVGIAAAGGVVTNSIPGPGCTDLGASQAVTITGATTSWRAAPTGVYTVSVDQAASRYTYALEVVSTNACTLAAGLNLQGSWTITGTNVLVITPCTGTLYRVYGRGL